MKKALIVVDLQDGFVTDQNCWILENVKRAIENGNYDLVVESIFHAEPGSLWDTQTNWMFPLRPTVPEIANVLPNETVRVVKTTKSVFKGDQNLLQILKDNSIEEIHVVGIDTGDCVYATAQEAFDYGFRTFVIEDCTEASENPETRTAALTMLRWLEMTKPSVFENASA